MGRDSGWAMEPLQPSDPRRVGSYRLLGRLGEGGMGRVFLGVSPGHRQVAVKIIRTEYAAEPHFRERFAREINAARQVGGFHTAPVVDADPDADPPWMVTAYIHGPSLQAAVTKDGPLSLDKVRELGAGLTEGLAAIHACGLVHRDLKPSNVILADDGPRIIDFGIARATAAGAITTVGFVVGTVSYMSPEQVSGEMVGPASDVFSLACTLVFASTGHTPFGDESIVTVVRRIASEPPDLTGVPEERGFGRLIRECLAKSAADRPTLGDILTGLTGEGLESSGEAGTGYAAAPPRSGTGPGADQRDQAGYTLTARVSAGNRRIEDHTADPGRSGSEPAVTRPPGPGPDPWPGRAGEPRPDGGRPGRRVPRRPVLIAAGVAFIVLLGAGLGILLSSNGKPGKAHQASGVHHSPPAPPGVSAPAQPEATLHDPNGKTVFGLWFSSDTVLASGDRNGSAYLWNVPGGKLTATLRDPASQGINDLAFSRNGNSFATADASGNVYLWDAATAKLTGTLAKNGRGAYSVAVSPDGGFVAVGDPAGRTFLWNVAAGASSGAPSATLQDPGGKGVYSVKFSPDGGAIAAGDLNGSTYLWRVATGKLIGTFQNTNRAKIYDIAFSPDGRYIAASDSTEDASVFLWNVATGKLAATLRSLDSGVFARVAFSPDSRFVAVADTNGSVHIWKVATGKFIASVFGPNGDQFVGVAFSPGGRLLAASNTAGSTYLWPTKWLNP
jgi:DNA-binding beta-propeller fold protein YncE/predicted Ser/Thr protein kinase